MKHYDLKYAVRFYDVEHNEWYSVISLNLYDAISYFLALPEDTTPLIMKMPYGNRSL